MTTTDAIRHAFEKVPVNRSFGFELVSYSDQGAEVRMKLRPEHLQETGVVQGGILSAIADTAAVYAFIPTLAERESLTSIEFKLNFLRPALLDRGAVVARSTVLRRGRKVGVCEVDVLQGDVVVAKGLFTYLFLEDRREHAKP